MVVGLMLTLLVSGCGGGGGVKPPSYNVSGRVTDANDVGVADVILIFSGGFGTAKTDGDGKWSKTGIRGMVTVSPEKDGWIFGPSIMTVSKASSDVNFSAQVSSGTTIGSNGGTVKSPDNDVTLVIPKNALSSKVSITISEANAPQGAIGKAYSFSPSGTQFAQPVTISFTYNPSGLPIGVSESDLVVGTVENGRWVALPTTRDLVNHSVSSSVSHFSIYGIIVQSRYALDVSIEGQGEVIRDPDQDLYKEGATVTLTASADPGWNFHHWAGDLSDSANPNNLVINENKDVTAVFTQLQYVVSVGSNGGGTVTKDPDKPSYVYGEVVTITANPQQGYSFTGWSGDYSGTEKSLSVTIDGNKAFTANFAVKNYLLNTSTIGEGVVREEIVCKTKGSYDHGTDVRLTAEPAQGWSFDHWEGDLTGNTNPATITVDSEKIVTAVFVQNQYVLSTSVTGEGFVTIEPSQATYPYGSTVELSAVPQAGWAFDHWEGDLNGTENPISLTVDGDKSIVAVFIVEQYTVAVEVIGNGAVQKDPELATYTYGTTVGFAASPDPGWDFGYWQDDLVGTDNPTSMIIDGNKKVIAVFTQKEYSVGVTTNGSGSVTRNPDKLTYTYGDSIELTATPEAGWRFDHWEGNITGNLNPTTLIVNGEMNITAVFTQNEYAVLVNALGSGSVTKNPSQLNYHYGDAVVLEAIPQSGWAFGHWNGDLTGSENPASIVINGNTSIQAVFFQLFNLDVLTDGEGVVSRDLEQDQYTDGSVVTLTATPSIGWEFDHWEGDLTGIDNPATVIVNSKKSVKAVFVQKQYVLEVMSDGSGTVNRNPNQQTYIYGTEVELRVTPDKGWSFDHWEGDLSGSSNPVTITIDGNKTVAAVLRFSIQAAITAANDGEIIIVPPGTYYEKVDFQGKSITVQSTNPHDSSVVAATVINGGGSGSVVTFNKGEGPNAVLAGFTIVNGSGRYLEDSYRGGGIFIKDSSPTIICNVIMNNSADSGQGIYAIGDVSSPTIIENTIVESIGNGWAAVNISGHNLTFENNVVANNPSSGMYLSVLKSTIRGNTIENNRGPGLWIRSKYGSLLADNVVEGNTIRNNGSFGIWCDRYSTVTLKDNCIQGNRRAILIEWPESTDVVGNIISGNVPVQGKIGGTDGAGIYIENPQRDAPIRILGNTIENNIGGNGGGIYVTIFHTSRESLVISQNIISNNTAQENGGGICINGSSSSGTITIDGNSFNNNSAARGGGLFLTSNASAGLKDNEFADNSATENGGGVYISYSSALSGDMNNAYSGNTPDDVYCE